LCVHGTIISSHASITLPLFNVLIVRLLLPLAGRITTYWREPPYTRQRVPRATWYSECDANYDTIHNAFIIIPLSPCLGSIYTHRSSSQSPLRWCLTTIRGNPSWLVLSKSIISLSISSNIKFERSGAHPTHSETRPPYPLDQ
jgi:hypothetical protein